MSRLTPVEQRLTILSDRGDSVPFLPWGAGESGAHTYLKLQKGETWALLDAGGATLLPVELQRTVMRLVNEGWVLQGEVHVAFTPTDDPGHDGLLETDAVQLELGRSLLPLLDPQLGSPLLEKLRDLRQELAQEVGFVLPGVKVCDNLRLPDNAYQLSIRQTPEGGGEIFLDRLLAVGNLDQLGSLQGWSTHEPAFRMTAKWIEPGEREKAQQAGCLVVGALNVLVTHVKELLRQGARDLLGLQDLYLLLQRLALTHPIVVQDFMRDTRLLRSLRRVLHLLLAEHVSIRNLVTILEVVGDHLDVADEPERIVEAVRAALGRQIMASYVDQEGSVNGLLIAEAYEQRLLAAIAEGGLRRPDLDGLVRQVRKTLGSCDATPVLFCDPALRRPAMQALARPLPNVAVLSLTEIPADVRVHVVAEVSDTPPPPPPPPEKTREGSMWKKKAR
ncbi:MAG: FHIPEP family type III secretion protein [Candidatus Xenobia bacterium]